MTENVEKSCKTMGLVSTFGVVRQVGRKLI